MIFGTTIAPGQTVRTETFQRQGDNAFFRYESIGGQGNDNSLTVKVYHKTSEETSWTLAATFDSGVEVDEVKGVREELTLEFSMAAVTQAVDEVPTTLDTNNNRVRVLPTQWYDDPVKA